MPKLMKRSVGNTKPLTKPLPVSQYISIREPVSGSGTENIIPRLIESLFHIREQQLSRLEAEGYDTFFTAFAFNPDKLVLKVKSAGFKGQRLLDADSRINQQGNKRK